MTSLKPRDAFSAYENTIVYMEIYGTNHIVYRVTASVIKRKGKEIPVYGIMLENSRTGSSEYIENFSRDLEYTLSFTRSLMRQNIRPGRLCCEALRELRLSPQCVLRIPTAKNCKSMENF